MRTEESGKTGDKTCGLTCKRKRCLQVVWSLLNYDGGARGLWHKRVLICDRCDAHWSTSTRDDHVHITTTEGATCSTTGAAAAITAGGGAVAHYQCWRHCLGLHWRVAPCHWRWRCANGWRGEIDGHLELHFATVAGAARSAGAKDTACMVYSAPPLVLATRTHWGRRHSHSWHWHRIPPLALASTGAGATERQHGEMYAADGAGCAHSWSGRRWLSIGSNCGVLHHYWHRCCDHCRSSVKERAVATNSAAGAVLRLGASATCTIIDVAAAANVGAGVK